MAEIETVREFWDRRPCNVRHSPLEVGTREYFEEVARRRYYVESHIRAFADFPSWGGKRVLDIGCGIGTDTVSFALNGANVIAVDLSPKSLEIARQNAAAFFVQDRIRFVCADAERLSDCVPPKPFDLIWCWGVLHHTPNPRAVVEQLRRYAEPGTVVKVMVYHRYSHKALLVRLGLVQAEAQAGVPLARTYTKAGAAKLLKPFRIRRVAVEHIFPWRIADYVDYRYVRAWPWSWVPPELFERLERRFGQHLCITAEGQA